MSIVVLGNKKTTQAISLEQSACYYQFSETPILKNG